MLKKMGIGIVVAATVLCMTTGMGVANQSSLSDSSKEMLNELKSLQNELAQLKGEEVAAGGIKERLEIARAKEEVLYKLGLWQGKLINMLIDTIASKIKEQDEVNKKLEAKIEGLQAKIEDLKAEVSLAKEVAAAAAIRADQAIKETRELAQQTEKEIALLAARVNDLVIRVKNLEEKLGVGPIIKLKSLESKEISVK